MQCKMYKNVSRVRNVSSVSTFCSVESVSTLSIVSSVSTLWGGATSISEAIFHTNEIHIFTTNVSVVWVPSLCTYRVSNWTATRRGICQLFYTSKIPQKNQFHRRKNAETTAFSANNFEYRVFYPSSLDKLSVFVLKHKITQVVS